MQSLSLHCQLRPCARFFLPILLPAQCAVFILRRHLPVQSTRHAIFFAIFFFLFS